MGLKENVYVVCSENMNNAREKKRILFFLNIGLLENHYTDCRCLFGGENGRTVSQRNSLLGQINLIPLKNFVA